MIFVMIFQKLSLYWYMKMFVGYAIRYVISLRKKSSKSTIVQQKSLSLSKHLPVASNTMNYVIIKETFSGRTF